ncbi:MAG: copper resistance protein CopC [Anaerolineae bacterium]|nr:copper resistance protein CopC [Anaerolineae bacterium]
MRHATHFGLTHARLIGLLAIVLAVLATPAHAHANLIDSSPSPGATLFTPPSGITLTFTEPVEVGFARLRVFDSGGAPLTMGTIGATPNMANSITSALPPDLPDGLYTVSWRVVSAADGHATEGAFTFGIGEVMVAGGGAIALGAPVVDGVAVAVRWLNLVSLGALVGWVGFRLWVLPTVSRRLFWGAWLMVGLTSGLVLLNQAATVTDRALWSAEAVGAVPALLTESAFGRAWVLRVLAWGALALVLRAGGGGRWLLVVPVVVLAYAQALTSHAAAVVAERPEAVWLDMLHVLAMGAWVGGLAAFSVSLRRGTPPQEASGLTDRFSGVARMAVGVLAITGLYSAWLHVGAPEPLTQTSYGLALTVKNVLLGAMLLLAGVNLVWTGGRLRQGKAEWVGILRGLVAFELVLGVGVLGGSAWMTSDMPAAEAYRLQQGAVQPALSASSFFEMQTVEDQMLHLDIVPAEVGQNTFTITLFNPDGTPMVDATRVSLRFTHLPNLVGESTLQLEHVGFGAYRAEGANLSVPGDWRVRLTVRQPGRFDLVTDFAVEIGLLVE